MNENDKIKDLESQAKNTRQLMDRLNEAYLGMTTEEILRLALKEKKESKNEDRDSYACGGDGKT